LEQIRKCRHVGPASQNLKRVKIEGEQKLSMRTKETITIPEESLIIAGITNMRK
jgi:hypothetical protein